MFKNTASQKVTLLVIDTATNLPKTGDAANLTAYVSKDDGTVTVLGDTSATELDATNAQGMYAFDLTQAETNADKLLFTGKSSTSGVRVVPLLVYSVPAGFTSLVIANGCVDADVERFAGTAGTFSAGRPEVNTTHLAGTSQTGRDIGASVLLSSGTGTGQVSLSSGKVAATIAAGDLAANSLTASALASDAVAEIQSGLSTLDAAGIRTAIGLATANLDTQLAALPTAGENADAVWDESIADHDDAGSTGEALSAAGSAGDPWTTALPGAYSAGQAGFIVGTNLDGTVSSRATQTSVDTIDGIVDDILVDTGTTLPAAFDGIPSAVWANGTRTLTSGGGGGGGGGETVLVYIDRPVPLQAVTAGQELTFAFFSNKATTGEGGSAVETPTNITSAVFKLYVNNSLNAAVITCAPIETGHYQGSVTLPGDIVATDGLYIAVTGTVEGVAVGAKVWFGVVPSELGDPQGIVDAVLAGLEGYTVNLVSPIDQSGKLRIAAGDDYTDESGQPLEFTINGDLPTLAGATLTLTCRPRNVAGVTIVGTGSLTSQVGSTAVIKVEIPRTQTVLGRNYANGNWLYDLQATLADGTVRTLKGPEALCTVYRDQTQ